MENNSTYVFKNGKKLRTGYTTGSCAAAAASAACRLLKDQALIETVTIDTPKGIALTLQPVDQQFTQDQARCAVIKDSGDDPDITNGMKVYAVAKLNHDTKVTIIGGEGVGTVTQPGLRIPVGQSAINPTPLKMIESEVRKVFGEPQGVHITIELPEGEALARKTFNPRLGIIGGLSILGTTGIVEPMSEDALKDTIALELNMLKAKGNDRVILVPGSIGEKQMHQKYGIKAEQCIKMSNYLGFTLDQCVQLGFKKVLVGGHIGKLVKPAGGIFYTHNRVSTTRMEILVAHLALLRASHELLEKVITCRTTDEAVEYIYEAGQEAVFDLLTEKAVDYCKAYCFDQVEIEFSFFSMTRWLSESKGFNSLLQDFLNA